MSGLCRRFVIHKERYTKRDVSTPARRHHSRVAAVAARGISPRPYGAEAECLRRKVEWLVAYPVLHPGWHPRESLASLLWGDSSDAAARASLRNALSILRVKLGDETIEANRKAVRLNPDLPLKVDVLEFSRIVERALKESDPEAIPELRSALPRYSGELLEVGASTRCTGSRRDPR